MVPVDSCRISRVPHYSGAVCRCRRGLRLRGFHPLWPAFPSRSADLMSADRRRSYNPVPAVTGTVWAPARSLATTCAITVVFFSSGYLDVSVPRVGPAPGAVPRSPAAGCPIRKSVLGRVFAPGHGLSQLVTSFFASESQGILHVPFSPFRFSLPMKHRESPFSRCPQAAAAFAAYDLRPAACARPPVALDSCCCLICSFCCRCSCVLTLHRFPDEFVWGRNPTSLPVCQCSLSSCGDGG